jgi:regulator of sigma E protease
MSMITSQLHGMLSAIGPFFILLGILIFVHELGHFLVAKFFGVRVEVFSLGFGRKILTYKKGDTAYCLSLIPLGGYVKMYGDDPSAEIPSDQKRFAFLHKPVLQRFAIVLAGPLMNLFFAIFVFALIVTVGEDLPGPYLGDIATDSKAYTAGFRSGDKILSIDGRETPIWSLVQKYVEWDGGKTAGVKLEREGQVKDLSPTVEFGENENIFSSHREIGQISGLTQESRSSLTGIRDPKSPAGAAGVKTLDLIVEIGGRKVQYWRELEPALRAGLKPDSKSFSVHVRDVNLPDKPENVRAVEVKLPEGWEKTQDLVAAAGFEPAELYIFQVKKDSPADRAGIQAKDRVVKIGNDTVNSWNEVLTHVKSYDPASDGLDFVISRDGAEQTMKIKPEMTDLMNPSKGSEEHRYTIGIISGFVPVGAEPVFYRLTNPFKIAVVGLYETAYWTEFVVMSLVRLVQGDVSPRNIGGIITIGRVASHSFAAGLSTFLRTMGIISINLFLLNLLPVPILDGGHLVFYSIEGLRGTPLSMRKMEIAQQVGLMLLMFLMAFAFFNDITNLFTSRF